MTRMETVVYGKADSDTGVRALGLADKVDFMWKYGFILYGLVCGAGGIIGTLAIQMVLKGGSP